MLLRVVRSRALDESACVSQAPHRERANREVRDMPLSGDKAARKRLGKLLVQARFEMNPEWRNRRLFAEEQQINYRLVQDIETAARQNFDDTTKMFIESKYGWALGSIDRVLEGGDPVKVSQVPPRVLALVIEAWGSLEDAPQHVREFAGDGRWDEQFRYEWITDYTRRDPAAQARRRGNAGGHLREA
jgi:hypothetical protein